MYKNELPLKKWLVAVLLWYLVTFGVFYLSERFNDIDAVLYPSVLVLIFCCLVGPYCVGMMCPTGNNSFTPVMKRLIVPICYIVGLLSVRLFYVFLIRNGLI